MSSCCTYVRPLLEFACQIWSPKYRYLIDKIESVQISLPENNMALVGLSFLVDVCIGILIDK